MAHVLQLSDGTTTVNFLGSAGASWCLLEDAGLVIKNPTKRETWTGSGSWRFGKELAAYTYDNRKITIRFEIVGDDLDDIFDKKTQIVNLIEDARDAQIRGLASRVYLQYQLDTTTNPVYFDVVDGELEIPEDLMSVAGLGWYKGGGQRSVKGLILDLTCKPFARGAEVQVVTNQTVNPTDDGSYTNYVSWSGSAIDGDVPGPLRIRFQNTSAQQIAITWVGLRDHGTPSSWSYNILEGEDSTDDVGSTPIGPNASYSDQYAKQWTLSGSDQFLGHWTIPDTAAASLINLRGRVRVILIGSIPSGAQVWLTMRKYITDYAIYPRILNSVTGLAALDMGVIDLLAWGVEPGQGAGYAELTFWAKGSGSLTLDALIMIPAEDYKFRSWRWVGYYLPQNAYMEDIGLYNQLAYGTTYKSFTAEPSGLPIHATPGNDARLYFTWRSSNQLWARSTTASINVWHTPYYLDIRGTS